ncbi:hypothetical protein J6590_084695 [Homalodisca vitripennis]|nr:hypothetical protein J6590_084695 [Homalodisca vitripennis]
MLPARSLAAVHICIYKTDRGLEPPLAFWELPQACLTSLPRGPDSPWSCGSTGRCPTVKYRLPKHSDRLTLPVPASDRPHKQTLPVL